MVKVLGKNFDKPTFLRHFGEKSQYASATPITFAGGNANGVKAIC